MSISFLLISIDYLNEMKLDYSLFIFWLIQSFFDEWIWFIVVGRNVSGRFVGCLRAGHRHFVCGVGGSGGRLLVLRHRPVLQRCADDARLPTGTFLADHLGLHQPHLPSRKSTNTISSPSSFSTFLKTFSPIYCSLKKKKTCCLSILNWFWTMMNN